MNIKRGLRKSSKAGKPDSAKDRVVSAAKQLRDLTNRLDFSQDVNWVYRPLDYAWLAHVQYIEKHFNPTAQVLLIGMNPGPWGMSQTGIPFGEVNKVRDWLGIDAPIASPKEQHPKRPVLGLACPRKEVSGDRFWSLFQSRFGKPEKFFKGHFVASYCPLAFLSDTGANITPDKLSSSCRAILQEICDQHLVELLRVICPKWLIGVGAWAEQQCLRVASQLSDHQLQVGRIMHPSPASPSANRNWAATVQCQLRDLGVW